MTYKEFGEQADVKVSVMIIVNDRVVFSAAGTTIDDGVAELGRAERHNFIANEIQKQYEELAESSEI